MLLGDFGAEVIKVEEPIRGDYIRRTPPFLYGQSAHFLAINRNKKSIVLDLKKPKGKTVFMHLVRTAEVVLEGFRPGVMDRLGLGYEHIANVNPRIIYCAISAYGHTGPLREQEGHDLNYLALSGLLSITGIKGGLPIIPGIMFSDYTGGMMAAIAILLALIKRQETGIGEYCDISMLDSIASLMGMHFMKYLVDRSLPAPQESKFNGAMACYNVYRTRDDRFVVLGAMEEKFWEAFCRLIEREDLIPLQWAEPAIQERVKEELSTMFRQKTQAEWSELLGGRGTCFTPVLNLKEVLNFPQLNARRMFQEIKVEGGKKIPQVDLPIKLSHTLANYFTPPPKMGQDTRNILQTAGFSPDEIRILEEDGIINTTPMEGEHHL